MNRLETYHLQLVEDRVANGMPWIISDVAKNAAISLMMAKALLEKHAKHNVFWILSYRHDLTDAFVEAHINEGWNWYYVLRCPNMSVDFLREYWYKQPKGVLCNPNAPLDLLMIVPETPDKYLHWSVNPSVTPDIVDMLLDKQWDWDMLNRNRNFTKKYLLEVGKYDWHAHYCGDVSADRINFDAKISLCQVARNLTERKINRNDTTLWECLSQNKHLFGFEKELGEYARHIRRG